MRLWTLKLMLQVKIWGTIQMELMHFASEKNMNFRVSEVECYLLNVCVTPTHPKLMSEPNPQSNSIWKWGLWR